MGQVVADILTIKRNLIYICIVEGPVFSTSMQDWPDRCPANYELYYTLLSDLNIFSHKAITIISNTLYIAFVFNHSQSQVRSFKNKGLTG